LLAAILIESDAGFGGNVNEGSVPKIVVENAGVLSQAT